LTKLKFDCTMGIGPPG